MTKNDLRERAMRLNEELAMDESLQQDALLARLMERCLAEPGLGTLRLGERLRKLVPLKHRALDASKGAVAELRELEGSLRLRPGLLEPMWRAHLAGKHREGIGAQGSGAWSRLSRPTQELRRSIPLRAKEAAKAIGDGLDLSVASPLSAIALAREELARLDTELQEAEKAVRQELGVPRVGRGRQRSSETDSRDLEAYFLRKVLGLRLDDPRVWRPYATPEEEGGLKSPDTTAKVRNRASKAIDKMTKRVESPKRRKLPNAGKPSRPVEERCPLNAREMLANALTWEKPFDPGEEKHIEWLKRCCENMGQGPEQTKCS